MYFIYALADPRSGILWYIGMTNNVYQRFMQHLSGSENNTEKNAWIQGLKGETLLPSLKILEVVYTEEHARERENYWIQRYLSEGMPLTNIQRVKGKKQSIVKNSPDIAAIQLPADLLSGQETATFLHVSYARLYTLIGEGKLHRIGEYLDKKRKPLLFSRAEVEALWQRDKHEQASRA